MRLLFAVDADGDEVQLAKDPPGALRPKEHAIGCDGIEISKRPGCGDQLFQLIVQKGFAAGEADDIVAEGCRLFKDVDKGP